MADAFLEDLFGLRGHVAVVIGGTGVLGGALSEGIVAPRDGRRCRRQRGSRTRTGCSDRSARRERDVPAGSTSAAARRSKNLLSASLCSSDALTCWSNCAGVNSASTYLDASDEEWQRVIDINLRGTHWGCQVFGAHMAAAGGSAILNIGSVTADVPLLRVFAYSASKAAVVNLTQNVARELRAARRPRQRALSGLLSRGAEPQDSRRRANQLHPQPNPARPLWRTPGAGRPRFAAALRSSRQLRHRHGALR